VLLNQPGESRLEYVVPPTQRQLQKKRRKEEARQIELTQRAFGAADETLVDA
jgi:hypothetical protein